jgi:ribosomal protein S2
MKSLLNIIIYKDFIISLKNGLPSHTHTGHQTRKIIKKAQGFILNLKPQTLLEIILNKNTKKQIFMTIVFFYQLACLDCPKM